MKANDDDPANSMLDTGEPIERCYLCLKCGDVFDSENDLLVHESLCVGEFEQDTQDKVGGSDVQSNRSLVCNTR